MDEFPDEGAQSEADDDAEDVFGPQGALDPDEGGAQSQPHDQGVQELLPQLAAEQDADEASRQHGPHVHEYRRHVVFPPFGDGSCCMIPR